MKPLIVSLLAFLGLSIPALAWDRPGHSVTAVIAYNDLAAHHPEVIPQVVALLKKSADYAELLNWKAAVAGAQVPENEMLFQLSARWPDDIKSDGSHRDTQPINTHSFHYINLPTGRLAAGHSAAEPNLFTAMKAFQAEWPTADEPRRAILLCWFLHLIGDSHQPLHAAVCFNSTFPSGDLGGNRWLIQPIPEGTELHAFWDNVVIESTDPAPAPLAAEVEAKAVALASAHPRSAFHQLKANKDLPSWVTNETFPLAVKVAYDKGKLPVPQPNQPTTLTAAYIKRAKSTAEAQMALAGYRIADFLVLLFGTPPS